MSRDTVDPSALQRPELKSRCYSLCRDMAFCVAVLVACVFVFLSLVLVALMPQILAVVIAYDNNEFLRQIMADRAGRMSELCPIKLPLD